MDDTMISALQDSRPDLVEPYRAALPRARAEILARVWGAICREDLDQVAGRHRAGDMWEVQLHGGKHLTGLATLAEPFTAAPAGSEVTIAGNGGCQDPGDLAAALGGNHAGRLAAELHNGVHSLALGYASTARRPSIRGNIFDVVAHRQQTDRQFSPLAFFEQSVVDGHPLHPGCRTRQGMSVADILAYGPEHRPVVDLPLLVVPPHAWRGNGLWPYRSDDDMLLPLHPWQARHVLSTDAPHLRLAVETIRARPLMSTRTFAPLDDRSRHLKTAIDVRLTSAARLVSWDDIADGAALVSVFEKITAAENGFDGRFRVLPDLAGGAVAFDGQPNRRLAAIVRRSAETDLAPGECALPVAALTADPGTGRPVVSDAMDLAGLDPHRWLAQCAAVLVPPCLTLLTRWGVALEAHSENMIIVVREGLPVQAMYRDLDGCRMSPRRVADAGLPVPHLRDGATEELPMLHGKLYAGLFVTTFGPLVATLSEAGGASRESLWEIIGRQVRDAFDALAAEPMAAADRAAALGDRLPIKAMTAMRLADDTRTYRWATIANPLS